MHRKSYKIEWWGMVIHTTSIQGAGFASIDRSCHRDKTLYSLKGVCDVKDLLWWRYHFDYLARQRNDFELIFWKTNSLCSIYLIESKIWCLNKLFSGMKYQNQSNETQLKMSLNCFSSFLAFFWTQSWKMFMFVAIVLFVLSVCL